MSISISHERLRVPPIDEDFRFPKKITGVSERQGFQFPKVNNNFLYRQVIDSFCGKITNVPDTKDKYHGFPR